MIPLCTTASLSVAWGWALFSVGRPWVAQRVWPMPTAPCSGSRRAALRDCAACPRRGGASACRPPASPFPPNYSRDIRAASARRRARPRRGRWPRMPTMPHIWHFPYSSTTRQWPESGATQVTLRDNPNAALVDEVNEPISSPPSTPPSSCGRTWPSRLSRSVGRAPPPARRPRHRASPPNPSRHRRRRRSPPARPVRNSSR